MTLAALLSRPRGLEPMNRAMHTGQWPELISRSLKELTMLVVGYGRIGRVVATKLAALGCTIRVCDPFLPADSVCPFPRVELLARLAEADAVTLHASGDRPMLGGAEFAAAKPGLTVLNSASGGTAGRGDAGGRPRIQTGGQGLVRCLLERTLYRPIVALPQVLLTTHTCTYTRRCRLQMEGDAAHRLGGVPLVVRALRRCLEAGVFDEVWVSSGHPAFGDIAEDEGVDFHQRPEVLGNNQATSKQFVAKYLEKHDCEFLLHVHSIAPLLSVENVRAFIQVMRAEEHDCLLSCESIQIECSFEGRPVNFTFSEKTYSQDLKPVQRIT